MQKNRKASGGLKFRNGIWHIDKTVDGVRFCKSCGTSEKAEAERFLARILEEHRKATVYGVRPARTFRAAATYYLSEYEHKKSIACDAQDLVHLDPFIGDLELRHVHDGTLSKFKKARKEQGVKSSTVNRSLAVCRHILNLCAKKWRDEYGLTWLESSPMISMVDWKDKRDPHPLTWSEQNKLFDALPEHLRDASLYKVNTGCRQQEVCQLRWDWEFHIPELKTSVFILPGSITKNGQERVVALNSVAMAMVNRQRGKNEEFVFTYRGSPMTKLNNTGWKNARKKVGLEGVRVHDLRHTTGRRLRAAGVSNETRKDILGHEGGNITTHYSVAEIRELVDAVELIAIESSDSTPSLTLIRIGGSKQNHAKLTQGNKKDLVFSY
jgi:integrase